MNRVALALCLVWPGAGQPGDVEHVVVEHSRGVYTLRLTMDLRADADAVYALVTDFDRLHLISPALSESHRVDTISPDQERRRMVTRTCILYFCFKAELVEDVEYIGSEIIRTTVLPELSDFRSGRMEWQVISLGPHRTRISLYCEVEPDFWIPPLIGPWVIKRKMLEEARQIVNRIEVLAGGG